MELFYWLVAPLKGELFMKTSYIISGLQNPSTVIEVAGSVFFDRNHHAKYFEIEEVKIEDGTSLISALIAVGACKSNREARDLIKGSSISVNGEKVTDLNYVLNASDAFNGSLTILKKGKKFYYAVQF